MALNFWRLLRPAAGESGITELERLKCKELLDCSIDYQIRELAFWACVNMVSKAFERCEFRTFVDGKEVRADEYWLWNFEPNVNQNAAAFRQKAIAKMFEDGEVLIVPVRRRDGLASMAVADDWDDPEWVPSRQNSYRRVKVWDSMMDRNFSESEVLHIPLMVPNMREVTKSIYDSYSRLVFASMRAFEWSNGQHWKVHVNQVASGAPGWAEQFQEMMAAQIKPFMESNGAILPEFDGYKYEDVGGIQGNAAKNTTRDIRALIDDILTFTATGFGIPPILLANQAATGDAYTRMLAEVLDPICAAWSQEITRKRFTLENWRRGSYLKVDSSNVGHFDLFGSAAAIEKLIGTGWSFNDLLRKLGEPTIGEPWADQHFITKNFGDAAAAGNGGENAPE